MKKYRIDLHKHGRLTATISSMVANHNSRRCSFNLIDIVGLINALKCAAPLKNLGYSHQWNTNSPGGTQLLISEDHGETYILTITQTEVHELDNASGLAQNSEK